MAKTTTKDKPTNISILKMSHDEAREFFLESESYFRGVHLPPYINFHKLLQDISLHLNGEELVFEKGKKFDHLKGKKLVCDLDKARKSDNANYHIFCNKNSKYEWRKLQLINPVLYVSLVNAITTKKSWTKIKNRFKLFSENKKINCASLPVKSESKNTNTGEQITVWLHHIEQESIKLSIDYKYLIKTDIANCYSSVYTHSIAWAIHGRKKAKADYNRTLIGNNIDHYIKCMNNGQTNSIPEGSVLIDLIAEIILGYADFEISKELKIGKYKKITNYKILRYRDDYRIFVNNPKDGDQIIKIISKVLLGINMRLSASKTIQTEDLIIDSVKENKLSWMTNKQGDRRLDKHLMLIYNHAKKFPNAGGLISILNKYSNRLERTKDEKMRRYEIPLLISIVTNIACNNPGACPNCIRILSILIDKIVENNTKIKMIRKIKNRFDKLPHSAHIEIWLQMLLYPLQKEKKLKEFIYKLTFEESICNLIMGNSKKIWDKRWISDKELRNIVLPKKIIKTPRLKKLNNIIPLGDINLFDSYEGFSSFEAIDPSD